MSTNNKNPNDLIKVPVYSAPISVPTPNYTTATPNYVPSVSVSGDGSGNNFWQTLGNIFETATKYVAPLINSGNGNQQQTGQNQNLQTQQQTGNQQAAYQIPPQTNKSLLDTIKENPLTTAGIVAATGGLIYFLTKK